VHYLIIKQLCIFLEKKSSFESYLGQKIVIIYFLGIPIYKEETVKVSNFEKI